MKLEENTNQRKAIDLTIFVLLCMDDGELPFSSHRDLTFSTKKLFEIIAKLGLILCVSAKNKSPKTKSLFIPSATPLHEWRRPLRESNDIQTYSNLLSNNLIQRKKSTPLSLHETYENKLQTDIYGIDEDRGHAPFARRFKCLGRIINCVLDDTANVQARTKAINKAMAMDTMNFIWNAETVPLNKTVKSHVAIPINFDLWNSESLSVNSTELQMLDRLQCKSTRRALKIRMVQVKDENVTNDQVRTRFYQNFLKLSDIWKSRLLKHIGRIDKHKGITLPKIMLSFRVVGKCIIGHPFRTIKGVTIGTIHIIIPSLLESSYYNYWKGYAENEKK